MIVEPAVESYAEAHTTPPPPPLQRAAEATTANLAHAQMMVGPLEGRFLEMLVFALGARSVLEIGTFTGYSSISMAAGLAPGGRIITCELDPTHAEYARKHIEDAGLSATIEVREGDALATLRSLEGPFDFVFIDAHKPSYVDYYETVLPMLAPGGLIGADNTLWGGRVADPSVDDEMTLVVRRFNDHVLADPRVTCVQLTVRDGVTLMRKNAAAG
jgi:caffeoyl-CoA O-methyltransferase